VLQAEFDKEKSTLMESLESAKEEATQAQVHEREVSVMAAENHDMKCALNMMEKTLLAKYNCDDTFLHLKFQDVPLGRVPPLLPDGEQERFYVRELGLVHNYEAVHVLGLAEDDMSFTKWTAFEMSDGSNLPLMKEAIKDSSGKITGFIDKDKVIQYPPQRVSIVNEVTKEVGIKRIERPDGKVKATVNKLIKRKYKGKAEKILEFLVKMCNEYLEHGHDGSAYHSARKLWDRLKNKEMTWEQKMELYLHEVAGK